MMKKANFVLVYEVDGKEVTETLKDVTSKEAIDKALSLSDRFAVYEESEYNMTYGKSKNGD